MWGIGGGGGGEILFLTGGEPKIRTGAGMLLIVAGVIWMVLDVWVEVGVFEWEGKILLIESEWDEGEVCVEWG